MKVAQTLAAAHPLAYNGGGEIMATKLNDRKTTYVARLMASV